MKYIFRDGFDWITFFAVCFVCGLFFLILNSDVVTFMPNNLSNCEQIKWHIDNASTYQEGTYWGLKLNNELLKGNCK